MDAEVRLINVRFLMAIRVQRRMWANWLTAALSIFSATVAIAEPRYAANEKITPIVGKAPDGAAISIAPKPSQLILLNFYFSGCGPCIEEVPELNKFAKDHANVRVIGVTFDSADKVAQFVRERAVGFEIVADAQEFIDKVGIPEYPELMLLSPEGKPISAIHGAVSIDHATKSRVNLLEQWFSRLAPKT